MSCLRTLAWVILTCFKVPGSFVGGQREGGASLLESPESNFWAVQEKKTNGKTEVCAPLCV